MKSLINFELSTTQEFLANLLEDALDNAVSSDPMEVNGVVVVLERVGEAEIRPEGKVVDVFLPLKIGVKRAAGLFTVEGNGAINLHLAVTFDISNKLRLKAKSNLVTHEWLERPILEIGALNIPVETLVNLVLKHHESIITAKIDSTLNQYSDLNQLLKGGLNDARDKVNELDLKGNKIIFDIEELAFEEPDITDGTVNLKGLISPSISINQIASYSEKGEVPFRWLDPNEEKGENNVYIPISFDYAFLEGELRRVLQGMEVGGKHFDVRSIDINGGSELSIRMVIDEPIKAEVYIKGRPIYNEIEGVLFLKELDVKVNPSNFIYKLTAPLVNRFVEGKMEDFFPLEINSQLSNLVKENIPEVVDLEKAKIKISQEGVKIVELKFEQRTLEAIGLIKGLNVRSVIGDK